MKENNATEYKIKRGSITKNIPLRLQSETVCNLSRRLLDADLYHRFLAKNILNLYRVSNAAYQLQ